MQIVVKTNFPEIAALLNDMGDGIATKATARSLNATMAQAKTAMSKEIRAKYVLSASKVNESLKIRKASVRDGLFDLEASLESPSQRGRSLNLINFGAKQTLKGVSIKISREGGRKLIPGAFIANNGRTVFKRVGKERLPIKALQTIDVAQMFNVKQINAAVVSVINEKFSVVFQRELKFYVDRFNAANP